MTQPRREREPVKLEKAPWDDVAPGAPRIRVNLTQNANGAWRRDQTIEWPSVDPVTPTDKAAMHDQLTALDTMIREHIQELYERDQEERDRYFAERERRDPGGNNFNYRRAG